MNNKTSNIQVFGTRGSSHAIRDFLHRSSPSFQWIEPHSDDRARTLAGVNGLEDDRLPICIFPDGSRFEHATVQSVSEKLGLWRNPSQSEYDLAIYGAGPAGLSAAVYGASEELKTVVVERFAVGGQAGSSPKIENYLGFPQGLSGAELAERAREQACKFGAEILFCAKASGASFSRAKAYVTYPTEPRSLLGPISVRSVSNTGDWACQTKNAFSAQVCITALALARPRSAVGRNMYSSSAVATRQLRQRYTLPDTPHT